MQCQLSRVVAGPLLHALGRPKIVGTMKVLPPGHLVPRPGRIEVRIGTPLTFGAPADEAPAKARRAVADQVMQAIQALSGQDYVAMYASDRKAGLATDGG